jgi:hypothetical protein
MRGDFSRDTFNPRKHYAGVLMQQGRVQLDADWNEQQSIAQHRAETEASDVVGDSGAPLHNAGFLLTTPDGKAVTIGAGRYYAGGILCENETVVDYAQQPDLPNPPAIADQLQAAAATAALLYLEVWRRGVSALDDGEIREVALGGPDTAVRAKTVWQVKALPIKSTGTAPISCGDSLPEWDALVAPGTGALSARAEPTPVTANLCLLPPSAGYQRLENQLYRVEIHQGGPLGTATFKWSRDNGTVVTAVESVNGQELIVHDLGRDATLGFSNGQFVELVDDGVELSGQPGQFLQIDHVVEASRTVVLSTAPAAVNLSLHSKLRRWDAPLATVGTTTTADGWTALEGGVQIKFETGTYKTGDYWIFAARTVTADVDWPFTTPQPPRGEPHRFVRLAIATLSGGALTIQDCRRFFTPLAEIAPAIHIAGVSWVNDDIIPQAQLLANGLQIFFDSAVTPPPGDAAQAVVGVTMDAPVPLKAINPAADATARMNLSLPLSSDLSFPNPTTLLWKPGGSGVELGNLIAFLVTEQVQRVRLRVHLDGAAIWSDQTNARLYLDGRTLGQGGFRADNSPRIDLAFPSGEGRRSSDFDSWFYMQLQLPPAKLITLTISPPLVNAGGAATGTVTLDNPAPSAGVTVALSSSAAQVVVPASVEVPAGALSATFNVTTTGAPNTLNTVITATATDAVLTAQFTVQVVSVAVSPAELTIFTGHSQQFSATVMGASVTDVTWSVQETAGGSVSATGFFIGQTHGDYHIVATSVADRSKNGVGIAHVQDKPKDKDKEKEKERTKDIADKNDKLALEKITAERLPQLTRPAGLAQAPALAEETSSPQGRAFIRPSERPVLTRRKL